MSYFVAWAGLQLAIESRLALNSRQSWSHPSPPSTRIAGVKHHVPSIFSYNEAPIRSGGISL